MPWGLDVWTLRIFRRQIAKKANRNAEFLGATNSTVVDSVVTHDWVSPRATSSTSSAGRASSTIKRLRRHFVSIGEYSVFPPRMKKIPHFTRKYHGMRKKEVSPSNQPLLKNTSLDIRKALKRREEDPCESRRNEEHVLCCPCPQQL